MNEERKYAVLKDDNTIELVPIAKYAAAVYRGIDKSNKGGNKFDPVLNEEVIKYHFQKQRTALLELGGREEALDLDYIQQDVLRWFKIENPVGLLIRDLVEAECSPITVGHYREAANRYMRFVGYEPEFTHEELFAFRNSLNGVSPSTRKWYMAVLKCWWAAMSLNWPIRSRPVHRPHDDTEVEVPSFTNKQMTTAIKLVKERGTPEMQFYFCLVTVFAPRRIEMANMTQANFTWNGHGDGVLKFNTHKHGLRRTHYIPKELAQYLHYNAIPMPEWKLSKRFREWCQYVGWTDPKPKEGIPRRMQGSWHAFRHGLNSALLESGFDMTMLNRWMGWRSGSKDAPMVGRYYNPEKLDELIQAKHPFIKLWAKNV